MEHVKEGAAFIAVVLAGYLIFSQVIACSVQESKQSHEYRMQALEKGVK